MSAARQLAAPEHDDMAQDAGAALAEGDLLLWQGRLASVDRVVTFAEAGTHVTISWTDGRGMAMSVRLDDLRGSRWWRNNGTLGPR